MDEYLQFIIWQYTQNSILFSQKLNIIYFIRICCISTLKERNYWGCTQSNPLTKIIINLVTLDFKEKNLSISYPVPDMIWKEKLANNGRNKCDKDRELSRTNLSMCSAADPTSCKVGARIRITSRDWLILKFSWHFYAWRTMPIIIPADPGFYLTPKWIQILRFRIRTKFRSIYNDKDLQYWML